MSRRHGHVAIWLAIPELNPSFEQMPPDELVAAFVKGLERGDDEIAPGQSRQLKWMSRLTPGFIFGQLNREPAR